MGLGPHGSSLLQRLQRPVAPGEDTLWVQIDQQARGEARTLARMRHQQKHKAPKKPEAPVAPMEKLKGIGRDWVWIGESLPSKNLHRDGHYSGEAIRAAGFKLPKLEKRKGKK